MRRRTAPRLLVLPSLLIAGACWGQAYRAEIAYTQFVGKADGLYLANSDGTRAVKVYSADKLKINGVDIAPGGGRVAFTDTGGSLWILPYTVTASSIVPGTARRLDGPEVNHGAYGTPDFSPDGTQLLYGYNRPKTEIRMVRADASSPPQVLLEGSEVDRVFLENPRWLRPGGPGDFVYTRHESLPSYHGRLKVAFFGVGGVTTATEFTINENGGPCYDHVDVARTRHALLLQGCSTGNVSPGFVEYDLIGRQVVATYNAVPGGVALAGHFSADDTQLVHARRNKFNYPEAIFRFTIAGQASLKLTKTAQFGFTDWKPPAP